MNNMFFKKHSYVTTKVNNVMETDSFWGRSVSLFRRFKKQDFGNQIRSFPVSCVLLHVFFLMLKKKKEDSNVAFMEDDAVEYIKIAQLKLSLRCSFPLY